MANYTNAEIETARKRWANTAKKNGWYKEPFFIQVWLDEDKKIIDCVSFRGLKQDYIIHTTKKEYYE